MELATRPVMGGRWHKTPKAANMASDSRAPGGAMDERRGRVTEATGGRDTDRLILRALEQDARRGPDQVAAMTGQPAAAVAAAIARLEGNGVIRGYRTLVNWDRVAEERVVAFIDVSVSPQRDVGFDQVAARIYRHPEVRSVHLVSGGHDLRIVVEGATMREVAAFVSEKLAPIDHVTATNTHFLLKAYKENGQVFIEEETDDGRLAVAP